jgi:hypothetical protein
MKKHTTAKNAAVMRSFKTAHPEYYFLIGSVSRFGLLKSVKIPD